MRYIKIVDNVIHSREVASHETQLIAELLAYGWLLDDGTSVRTAAPEVATRGAPRPPSPIVVPPVQPPVLDPATGQPVNPALATATTMFEGEWPAGLPPEWFAPLHDRFDTPDAVRAATSDELLALPGATHVTVAMLRAAFREAAEG